MIRVTVEIVKFGICRPETLGTIDIINDGSGTTNLGNYRVKVYDSRRRNFRNSVIHHFHRRSRNHWQLLAEALRAVRY